MTATSTAALRATGSRVASTRRLALLRTPRARSLLLLGTVGVLGGLGVLAAQIYTELLWFEEIGAVSVFWTTLKWKVLASGFVGLGTAGLILLNFAVVERALGRTEEVSVRGRMAAAWPYRRLAYPVVAIVGGLISIGRAPEDAWRLLLLWSNRGDFGVEDPLFHRDVGYFVFALPLERATATWLLETLVMAAVTGLAVYAIAGLLRRARPVVFGRAVRVHLLVLGAVLLLVIAWRLYLERFQLELGHGGSAVPGATYTDVNVGLPTLTVLMLMALAGAVLCLYSARRRPPFIVVVAVAAVGLMTLVGRGGVAALVDRFEVQPQELSRERPYVADAIAATRSAFQLDGVKVRSLPTAGDLSAEEIAENQPTVENVPLWDQGVLRPAMNELESIGRYFNFGSTTTDRYTVDGETRVYTVAGRQLDLRDVGPETRGWATERFAYTHGYGVVAAEAGATDADRQPRFAQGEFDLSQNPLTLDEPRLYYGERRGPDPPYVVAGSRRGEVDAPVDGSAAPDYHYEGSGGISLSDPLRRLAFAARFGDLKLLLSETPTEGSRILLHRGVRDRVQTLAPFLRWDARPQTAVIDGQVKYLLHGYATSSSYPYSAPIRMGGSEFNYMRQAATASVDAFTGQVSLYAAGSPDPILRAWQAAYPGLFLAASEMPPEMRDHLRYPEELFAAQLQAYATYHAEDPTAFWNATDAWEQSNQLAGPAEIAGEIQFPDPARSVDVDERRDGNVVPADWRLQPSYLFAQLPGDSRERFMLTTSFTPRGRENLVSYLAGSVDRLGDPRLTAVTLPRDQLTPGPTQATRQILASPEVNRRIDVLNRESRDLGTDSVNRTILGAPRVVPIGDAFVYVQPIYLVAGGGGVPRLQLVTALANGEVGCGRDLESALAHTSPQ